MSLEKLDMILEFILSRTTGSVLLMKLYTELLTMFRISSCPGMTTEPNVCAIYPCTLSLISPSMMSEPAKTNSGR